MFYKQRILADFWGRKDSAVGINKLFIAHSIPVPSTNLIAKKNIFVS